MPELPEVEALRRALEPEITGREILRVSLRQADVIAWPTPVEFAQRSAGTRIDGLERRGKYLGFDLAGGSCLWLHLRMTGKLSLVPPQHPLPDHTHVIFSLDDGRQLRFYDTRRFGRLWYLMPGEEEHAPALAALGDEPFSLDGGRILTLLGNRHRPIKSALLDQHLIAGLGNIYADEILFRAGISPLRQASTLTAAEADRIAQVMGPVLEEAIRRGVNCSRELFGKPLPSRQPEGWRVYGRGGQPCSVCGTPLVKVRIAGRTSVFCPQCQS